MTPTPSRTPIWLAGKNRQLFLDVLVCAEHAIYMALALALILGVGALMVGAIMGLNQHAWVITFLDDLLITLMLLELFHTIMLFLKTHHFRHEPFLVVGIIAGIRRILIITAERSVSGQNLVSQSNYLEELAVTTAVVLVLAIALRLSRVSDSEEN